MAKQSSINQKKYDNENILKITIKLHKRNDKDIIDNIDLKNKQGSIKALVREALNIKNKNKMEGKIWK